MGKDDKQPLEERVDMFLAERQEKYSHAIAEAHEAAITTATEAWKTNYETRMKEHRVKIGRLCDDISSLSKHTKDADGNEEDEKDIKKAVKELGDERLAYTAWWMRAVDPLSSRANVCQTMLIETARKALAAEEDAPLVNRGLAEAVAKRTAKWPTAKWDQKTGVVTVQEKDAEIGRQIFKTTRSITTPQIDREGILDAAKDNHENNVTRRV